MSAPANSGGRTAQQCQLQFDWLLPDKAFLRVADVAAATGMRMTFIEEYFAHKCHRFLEEERTRAPMRIPRAFVIELLVKSAKYDTDTKLQAISSCFREFTAPELLELRAAIDAQLRNKTAV